MGQSLHLQNVGPDFGVDADEEPYCLVQNDLAPVQVPLRVALVENPAPRLPKKLLESRPDMPKKPPTYRLRDGIELIAEHFKLLHPSVFFQQAKMSESVISSSELRPGYVYCVRGDPVSTFPSPEELVPSLYRVGVLSDARMLAHADPKSMISEKPSRYISVLEALDATSSLRDSVVRISETREATADELSLCHDLTYILRLEVNEVQAPGEVYFAPEEGATATAAKVAAGTVLTGLYHIFSEEIGDEESIEPLDSCFCVVRPPGHHSLRDRPMGFCFFSNVAIGAKWIRKKYPEKRVLIVDWDVHHGNGTQDLRMDDPEILLISLQLDIYPGTGQAANIGKNGNTVNVLFREPYGDHEIVQAFHSVVLPIAYEFAPDVTLVSAGFDAVVSDPLGGCNISPSTFGYLTTLLMQLTGGKRILMALEGGYNQVQLKSCFASCVHALLGHQMSPPSQSFVTKGEEKRRKISRSALEDIVECQKVQSEYWECMRLYRPDQPRPSQNEPTLPLSPDEIEEGFSDEQLILALRGRKQENSD